MTKYLIAFFIFISICSFIFCGIEVAKRYKPNAIITSTPSYLTDDSYMTSEVITRVDIESLKKSLPVQDLTNINSSLQEKFSITSETMLSLVKVGDNTVLFGHNWPNLLGNLKMIKKGDLIRLDNNKNTLDFEVTNIYEVTADQTHVLLSSGRGLEKITVITCSGFLDSKRLVVVGKKLES